MLNRTHPPEQPAARIPRPWILVVDDEESMRHMIGATLDSQGWAAASADGAEEALEVLRSRDTAPAVVICDVLMPGTDGLELVRRMCAGLPDLSVIFISGRLSDVSWWPEDLREKRFLPKPFEASKLVAAVKAALEGRPHR